VHWRGPGATPRLTAVDDVGAQLERTIGELLGQRRPEASVCPSEAARAVAPDGWRDLRPEARAAAARLVAAGDVEVTQGGEVVDVRTARGPVRIRRPRPRPEARPERARDEEDGVLA
jgi:hypothetical protein